MPPQDNAPGTALPPGTASRPIRPAHPNPEEPS